METAASHEKVFTDQLEQFALRAADPKIRAILISGPSASGKTTTTHRLEDLLKKLGRNPLVLSLDDYYASTAVEYDAEGRPDFESICTLALDLIVKDISAFMREEEVHIPTFDFMSRSRNYEDHKRCKLPADGVLLIEGLHALAPEVVGSLPAEQYLSVFLMPHGALHRDQQLLNYRDIRILRRVSRDVTHRGSTALSTIDYWPMMDRTETEIFPPYLARADVMINTILPYEFLVVAPLAGAAIRESLRRYEQGTLPGSAYNKHKDRYANLPLALSEARRLEAAIEHIPAAPPVFVPTTSILHEFIS